MTDLGLVALFLALAAAVYAILSSLVGYKTKREWLLLSARNAIYAVCGFATLASLVLFYALVTHDFQVAYVAQHTSRDLPLAYALSAFWAGQEGSLLLWVWLLAVTSAVTVARHRPEEEILLPQVMAWLMLTEASFLVLIILFANPFQRLGYTPLDGLGLNPLLRNPGMIFHPPAIYLGYAGFTVPFGFAMAALITGRLDEVWVRATRRCALISWLFLSLGIGLGAQWAYVELGWGGYWAWDPVENVSLIPWLAATAFLHSLRIQEQQGRFKVWNLVLVGLTFLLCIFGTFVTRSGIIESVHSFAVSNLGPCLLFYLGFTGTFFTVLLLDRLSVLRSERAMGSLFSREAAFSVNNLLLLGAAIAILWGTVSPLVSEMIVGRKMLVSASFFERANGPIFLAVLFLMGICPAMGWKGISLQRLLHGLRYPLALAFLVALGLYLFGVRAPYALASFSLGGFVLVTLLQEARGGITARRGLYRENHLRTLVNLMWRERGRYGGYIVHLAIVLIMMGVTASTLYRVKEAKGLLPGEGMIVKDYALTYNGMRSFPKGDHWAVVADVLVTQGERAIGYLSPEVDIFCGGEERTSEVALRSTPLEDLYLVLTGFEYQLEASKDLPCGSRVLLGESQLAVINAMVNPLVTWIWLGGIILVAGTLIAAWPERARNAADSAATGSEEG